LFNQIKSHPDDFKSFALTYVTNGTMLLADEALAEYGVPEADQHKLQGDLIEGWYHDLAPPDNNLI